jgi:dTDP-4-amino-4,6-dideoxygalactose transaminase
VIPFNRATFLGPELAYVQEAIASGRIAGDGSFSQRCHKFLEQRYGFHKALLTTSCTDALEMAAILLNLKPGDEVIMPAYTFVSTANAFVLRGATIRFCDVLPDTFNLDPEKAAPLITNHTRAIVPVHYAGVACPMDEIMELARQNYLSVVEDAAQGIESFYKGKPLGSIGDLGTFSFHETKNITCGEGGALAINNPELAARAEIIREKGTNRSQFFRGEANKYEWQDIGSSFLPADLNAAYLLAQLEAIEQIQAQRIRLWERYREALKDLADAGRLQLPHLPDYATNNANLFYLLTKTADERTLLLEHLTKNGIKAVFHYLPLHKSRYFQARHDGRDLPVTDQVSDCIVRLPLYYALTDSQQEEVIDRVLEFYSKS